MTNSEGILYVTLHRHDNTWHSLYDTCCHIDWSKIRNLQSVRKLSPWIKANGRQLAQTKIDMITHYDTAFGESCGGTGGCKLVTHG